MSNTIQGDFIAALEALAPEGVTARRKAQFANTGSIYYQDADFATILGVSYDFQDGYASFNLTDITDEERKAIGARQTASRPKDMTWHGWGHVEYSKGELRQVRDGVAYLLRARAGSATPTSGKMPVPGYGEISWYRSERDGVLVVEIDTDDATEAAGTADSTGVPQIRVHVNDDPIWEHPPYPEGDIHPWVAPDPQAVAAGEADADACDECGEVEDHWRHHVPDPSLEDDLRTIRKANDDEGVPLVGEED